MGKFTLKGLGGNRAELGVSGGAERYDAGAGTTGFTTVVDLDELDDAVSAARKEGRQAEKDAKDNPFVAHIDPNHPSADSSFRSEDRPPIYISSDTNPSQTNPSPSGFPPGSVGAERHAAENAPKDGEATDQPTGIQLAQDTTSSRVENPPVSPSGIDRRADGLANVIGNQPVPDSTPGPNVATPPEGVPEGGARSGARAKAGSKS